MQFKINVVVDAMGGDNAPDEIILGAVNSVKEREDVHVFLVGQESVVESRLQQYEYNKAQITVVNASEIIETAESPVAAIRKKKDSSIVVGMKMVREGKADAFVSAGSSGAILVGGQLIVGRSKGIERPPLAVLMPTENGVTLLIDCGANVDAKPSNLLQFAQMGSIYMEHVLGVVNPRVGIVNIGAEEEKGNRLVKETFPLLKECNSINFIGSVESREIPHGQADVVVCEAFVGNVILKLYEGLADTLIQVIKKGLTSNLISSIGAAMAKPSLKKVLKSFDASEYGGAPLLGLNGLVVKAHGNSTSKEIRNAILQCITFKEQMINEWIHECITGEYVEALHQKENDPEPETQEIKDEPLENNSEKIVENTDKEDSTGVSKPVEDTSEEKQEIVSESPQGSEEEPERDTQTEETSEKAEKGSDAAEKKSAGSGEEEIIL